MAILRRYTLADFEQLGQSEFPDKYEVVADENQYEFRMKYHHGAKLVQYAMIFRVGRSNFKDDGPEVWAALSEDHVCYYNGRETILWPMKEALESKVYYSEPFSFFAGRQDANGMMASRRVGKISVETMIRFLFLKLDGRMYDFESNRKEHEEVKAKFEHNENHVNKKGTTTRDARYGLVRKTNPSPYKQMCLERDMSTANSFPDQDTRLFHFAHKYPAQAQLSSVINEIENYREQISAATVQDRDTLNKELQALKAELQKQKQLTLSEKESHATEIAKRQELERAAVEARQRLERQDESIGRLEEQVDRLEEHCIELSEKAKYWKGRHEKLSETCCVGAKRMLDSLNEEAEKEHLGPSKRARMF